MSDALMMVQPSILELFCTFFYIGLFTIGGGLVSLTLMQQTVVAKGWITPEKFFNMVAVSESTPGPIGVNMATYVGNEFYGVPGGIITTMGQVLPSVICILIIAKLFSKFQEKPLVKAAFSTLRPATTGIVMVAAAQVFTLALLEIPHGFPSSPEGFASIFKVPSVIFSRAALFLLFKTKIHPAFLVLAGAVFGIFFL